MAPDKRRPRPGGIGRGPLEFIAGDHCDGSDHTVDISDSQLLPRDVRPDEIPELRSLWWRQASFGHRLPAEINVIVIEGGAT